MVKNLEIINNNGKVINPTVNESFTTLSIISTHISHGQKMWHKMSCFFFQGQFHMSKSIILPWRIVGIQSSQELSSKLVKGEYKETLWMGCWVDASQMFKQTTYAHTRFGKSNHPNGLINIVLSSKWRWGKFTVILWLLTPAEICRGKHSCQNDCHETGEYLAFGG